MSQYCCSTGCATGSTLTAIGRDRDHTVLRLLVAVTYSAAAPGVCCHESRWPLLPCRQWAAGPVTQALRRLTLEGGSDSDS